MTDTEPAQRRVMATNGKNGNWATGLAAVVAGLSFFVSLATAFFQAANPKGDITSIRYEVRDDVRRSDERYDRELSVLRTSVDGKLGMDVHKEFATRKDRDTDVLRDEINRIRADQVPRSEHQQHWSEIADRMTAFRTALADARQEQALINSEMRKEFGSTFTAGDQMKNLQDQIKTLQQRLDVVSRQISAIPGVSIVAQPSSVQH